jgi:hypothetical protein
MMYPLTPLAASARFDIVMRGIHQRKTQVSSTTAIA